MLTSQLTHHLLLIVAGAVYVYHRESLTSWVFDFMGVVMAPDAAEDDRFGNSVGIVGDLFVVGAPDDDDIDSSTGKDIHT